MEDDRLVLETIELGNVTAAKPEIFVAIETSHKKLITYDEGAVIRIQINKITRNEGGQGSTDHPHFS